MPPRRGLGSIVGLTCYNHVAPLALAMVQRPSLAKLARDYQEMRDMFLDTPMPFDTILPTLRSLETRINKTE